MGQSLNFFSKLFSSKPDDKSPDHSKQIQHLETLFKADGAEFFYGLPIFSQKRQQFIDYMMVHPSAGVVLFHFFDHDAPSLKNVKARAADENCSQADIQTDTLKELIQQRFDDLYHKQLSPVRSILVCPNLSEGEFDYLDESFHTLIPKNSVIFNDHTDKRYKEILLPEPDAHYDIDTIKQALFAELLVSQTEAAMTDEQGEIIHLALQDDALIQGVPGSGKSSILIAKALYEKMKSPELNLLIFGKRACHVHHLQSLIFSFIEKAHWALNPADIQVSSYETLQKRVREKEKFDLIVCDDLSPVDLSAIQGLKAKHGHILASYHYPISDLHSYKFSKSFRLSPAIEAACEGLEVEALEHSLKLLHGNVYMHTIVTLQKLLKEVPQSQISIVVQDNDELLKIKAEIDAYFTPITYLFDNAQYDEGIGIYPLSYLSCLYNSYIILIIDDFKAIDPIELISRASQTDFILSESEEIYNIITTIKGYYNEPH